MADLFTKNFLVRAPEMDDLNAVVEMLLASDMDEWGQPDTSIEEVRSEWQAVSFNLETDARVVVDSSSRIVGYASVRDRGHGRIISLAKVHPNFRGLGIATQLVGWAEERARQHIPLAQSDARVTLSTHISHVNEDAGRLLISRGYHYIRSTWAMAIEMEEAPQEPEWPEGITLRPFIPGKDDRAVFEAVDEAFADHWGHTPGNFERWKDYHLNREDLDPALLFLAYSGDEIAGASLCGYYLGLGIVNTLGVRRPWRRAGLGMALLLHSFGEFYKRGNHKVVLGVDSQNLTGATRLYERAGMHIELQYDTYEKELRAGIELSTRSLTV
ncbi:MAG TPA: GNAT family N-acetyltransferase [Ktedonobacteraceae bacterium]